MRTKAIEFVGVLRRVSRAARSLAVVVTVCALPGVAFAQACGARVSDKVKFVQTNPAGGTPFRVEYEMQVFENCIKIAPLRVDPSKPATPPFDIPCKSLGSFGTPPCEILTYCHALQGKGLITNPGKNQFRGFMKFTRAAASKSAPIKTGKYPWSPMTGGKRFIQIFKEAKSFVPDPKVNPPAGQKTTFYNPPLPKSNKPASSPSSPPAGGGKGNGAKTSGGSTPPSSGGAPQSGGAGKSPFAPTPPQPGGIDGGTKADPEYPTEPFEDTIFDAPGSGYDESTKTNNGVFKGPRLKESINFKAVIWIQNAAGDYIAAISWGYILCYDPLKPDESVVVGDPPPKVLLPGTPEFMAAEAERKAATGK